MLLATRQGSGAGADSVLYVTAARNFAAGDGVSTFSRSGQPVPLTYFPPLLPVSLGLLGGAVAVDPLATARWFNAALFGATALVAMLLTYRYSAGRSVYAAVLAGAVIATSPHLLQLHASVMSEPLFLFLCLAGFLLFCHAFESGSARLLLLSALVVGLASLTRFTGVVACASGALVLLECSGGPWSSRAARAAAFAAVSLAPLAAWLASVKLAHGTVSPRTFTFHAPQAEHLASGIYTLRTWLVPEGWGRLTQEPSAALGFTAFCLLTIALVRHMPAELTIYSNAADAIYILTGRFAARLPVKFDPASRLSRERYPDELAQMERELDSGAAVVVYLRRVSWRSHLPDEEELEESIGLRRITRTEDGAVYSGDDVATPPSLDSGSDALGSTVAALHTLDERRERGVTGRLH